MQPESCFHNSQSNRHPILSLTTAALSHKLRSVVSTAHRQSLHLLSDVMTYRGMSSIQHSIRQVIRQWDTPRSSDDETNEIPTSLLAEVKEFCTMCLQNENFTMEFYWLKSEGIGSIAFHKTLVGLGVLTGLTSLLCRSFLNHTWARLKSNLGFYQCHKMTAKGSRIPVLPTTVTRSPMSRAMGTARAPNMEDLDHSSSLRGTRVVGEYIKPARKRVRDLFDSELVGSHIKTTPVESRIPVLPRALNASVRKRASGDTKRTGAGSTGWKFAEDLSSS